MDVDLSSEYDSESSDEESIVSSEEEESFEEVPKSQPMAESIDDAMNNLLAVTPSSPKFNLRPHQQTLLNYCVKRMKMVKFENTPTAKYKVVEAPNHGIQGGAIVAEKGMGKTRLMLELPFRMKRISGPWLIFESLTLIREIENCLREHFAPEYHSRVLFYHPTKLPGGQEEYNKMTSKKLRQYTIIVMTIESYMTMVNDYDFQEESAQIMALFDGTKKTVGYNQCTYEQVQARLKCHYTGPASLMELHYDGVCIDESHSIRNVNTSRSVSLTTVARLFNFLFTGDLMVNSSDDLYNQLKFMGYKGAQSLREWQEDTNFFKKRDKILADPIVEALDKSDATSPIKVMSIKADAPYLEPPPLHLVQEMLEYNNTLEIEFNKGMLGIMETLIKAADGKQLSKQYIFAFFTMQNLGKIAPYLTTVASKREGYKVRIFTETNDAGANKTLIGDEAFDSYFTNELLATILSSTSPNVTLLSAPMEDKPSSTSNNKPMSEHELFELGGKMMNKVLPKMSDLISDPNGPAGMDSTTMQWIVKFCRDVLTANIPPNCKIIIGTNYTVAADLIVMTLKRDLPQIMFTQVDGSIKGKKRNAAFDTFINNILCRLLIVNLKIGSLGLNLQVANFVIDVDGWYNDVIPNQFICRVWRPGQQYEVFAHQLFRVGTIDEHIMKLRDFKRENIADFWNLDTPMGDGPQKKKKKEKNEIDFETIRKINNVQPVPAVPAVQKKGKKEPKPEKPPSQPIPMLSLPPPPMLTKPLPHPPVMDAYTPQTFADSVKAWSNYWFSNPSPTSSQQQQQHLHQ